MTNIGERIKSRRLELKMSQEEIAAALGYKSRSSINKIEKDGRNLPQDKIFAIAQLLRTTPSYIMGWEDEVQQPSVIEEEPTLDSLFDMLSDKGQESLISYMRFLETDPSNLDPDKFVKEIFLDGLSVEARAKRKSLAKELRIQNNLEKSINRHK